MSQIQISIGDIKFQLKSNKYKNELEQTSKEPKLSKPIRASLPIAQTCSAS
jgi:hypothetical protein